mgnify:CR=1 FL=1
MGLLECREGILYQLVGANQLNLVFIHRFNLTGFAEKPVSRSHINAGVYAFAPAVLDHLARHRHCDMPTLFDRLREAGHRTVAYPMHEPWLDVGRPDDLERANATLGAGTGDTEDKA